MVVSILGLTNTQQQAKGEHLFMLVEHRSRWACAEYSWWSIYAKISTSPVVLGAKIKLFMLKLILSNTPNIFQITNGCFEELEYNALYIGVAHNSIFL